MHFQNLFLKFLMLKKSLLLILSTDFLASPFRTLRSLSMCILSEKLRLKWTLFLKPVINSAQLHGFPQNETKFTIDKLLVSSS